MHWPVAQIELAEQLTQARPPTPHALAVAPNSQAPLAEQQPVQLDGSHFFAGGLQPLTRNTATHSTEARSIGVPYSDTLSWSSDQVRRTFS